MLNGTKTVINQAQDRVVELGRAEVVFLHGELLDGGQLKFYEFCFVRLSSSLMRWLRR